MSLKVPNTKITRASVYKDAGEARYEEAEYLKEQFPSGAIHLAGYLIECYLKWALCQRNGVQYLQELPDKELVDRLTSGKEGHDLEQLSIMAHYDDHIAKSVKVKRAFQIAAAWSPNIRYVRICGERSDADQFFRAVKVLREDILSWANL